MNQLTSMLAKRKDSHQRAVALARWDNEGGAGPSRKLADAIPSDLLSEAPREASAELVQLRIRVIALENLLITLLAGGSEPEFALAHSMTRHVSPRPGFTHHRMTLHAAAQMRHLIKRAGFFRDATAVAQRRD
jgi:hypothetical protein